MKKIIVPVDFSDFSEYALETAAFFAKKYNASIVVVHLLDLAVSDLNQTEDLKNEQYLFKIKVTENKFKEFLNKNYLEGISIKSVIRGQKDFNELNYIAIEEKADLVIMGSHGVSGLRESLMGSNTEKVVRNSRIPVMITKEVPITSDFKKAVFSCDFSDDDIKSYKKAKELLDIMGCSIQLLNVNTPRSKFRTTKELKSKAANFLQKATGSTENLNEVAFIHEHNVEEGILYFATTHNKDLIIMATHGKRGLEHFLDGSISENIANHATLPVLTFRI